MLFNDSGKGKGIEKEWKGNGKGTEREQKWNGKGTEGEWKGNGKRKGKLTLDIQLYIDIKSWTSFQ